MALCVMIPVERERLVETCRRYHVSKLSIFGSALREDFRADSDVDVLVEFGPDARVGLLAMGRMQRELAALFHHPVDLAPKDGLKPRIREAVLASTEVLYAG